MINWKKKMNQSMDDDPMKTQKYKKNLLSDLYSVT